MVKYMKKIIFTLMLVVSVAGIFNFQTASASHGVPPTGNCKKSFLGLPAWYEYLEVDPVTCSVNGPHETVVDDKSTADTSDDTSHDRLVVSAIVTRVALAVIDILMRVGGMVAFGFLVYSGFKFTLSQGNSDQEKSARETAINAVIGMVITIFAIGIVTFIGNRISS